MQAYRTSGISIPYCLIYAKKYNPPGYSQIYVEIRLYKTECSQFSLEQAAFLDLCNGWCYLSSQYDNGYLKEYSGFIDKGDVIHALSNM